jgi:hypothetical protein
VRVHGLAFEAAGGVGRGGPGAEMHLDWILSFRTAKAAVALG